MRSQQMFFSIINTWCINFLQKNFIQTLESINNKINFFRLHVIKAAVLALYASRTLSTQIMTLVALLMDFPPSKNVEFDTQKPLERTCKKIPCGINSTVSSDIQQYLERKSVAGVGCAKTNLHRLNRRSQFWSEYHIWHPKLISGVPKPLYWAFLERR